MNGILKAILMTAETVAVTAIPGAQAVDSGVRAIIKGNRADGILDAAEGSIKVIEAFKEADIADEKLFREGIAGMEADIDKIRRSLKPTTTH